MSAVSQMITNLFNGVSEQPPALRDPSQAELQENFDSALVRGLSKRARTVHVAKLITGYPGQVYFHLIDRSSTEKWIVVLDGSDIRVFNALTGAEATITYLDTGGAPIAKPTYLSSAAPRYHFKCLTVADHTFVLNTEFTTTSGLVYNGPLTGTVNTFSGLPAVVAGAIYKILGTAEDGFNSYYVKGNATATAWEETWYNNVERVSNSSMPWKLIKTGASAFALQQINYLPQLVGDADIIPYPSFIGRKIRDIFFYRNRLGFITDETIVLSRAGDYFNFYPKTATAVLDDDPMDEQVAHPKIVALKHAVPFTSTLILFGDTIQFSFTAGDILAPGKARLDVLTEHACDPVVPPRGIGPNLYFAQPAGTQTRVREFYIEQDILASEADDITKHVPNIIGQYPGCIAACASEDMLVVMRANNFGKLSVYRQKYQGEKRIQSAWFTFNLAATGEETTTQIYGVAFSGSRFYLMIRRGDDTYLEYIDFGVDTGEVTAADGETFQVHLDRLKTGVTGSYDSGTDTTTWTVPYATSAPIQLVVTGSGLGAGTIINTSRPTTTTATAPGDWSAYTCAMGTPYTARYRLSPLYLRGEGQVPRIGGRLQLRKLRALVRSTGYIRAEITALARTLVSRAWSSYVVGSVLNKPTVSNAEIDVAIMSDASTVQIDFVSDSPYPVSLTGIEWIGFYSQRARSV